MSEDIVLQQHKNYLSDIPEFVIHVDEPVWNVIVFITLNLVALPVLEFLSDLLVRKTASMKVLKDERILLSDSRLGILSLYSTYYGRYRSLMFMVLLGVIVIIMETFAEFCSSSKELSEQTRVEVWKIAYTHNFSYIHGGSGQGRGRNGSRKTNVGEREYLSTDNVTFREDRLESVLHSKDCIFSVEDMDLRLNDSGSSADFVPVLRPYYMKTQISNSKMYLSSDNRTIVCDYFVSKPKVVEVLMPAVGMDNGKYVTPPAQFRYLRSDARQPINWSERIRLGGSRHVLYGFRNGKLGVNQSYEDAYTCLQMYADDDCGDTCESVACAIFAMRDYTLFFGFGEGSVVRNGEVRTANITRWRMESRNEAAAGNSSSSSSKQKAKKFVTLSERSVRFVVRMYLEGYIWGSQNEEVERRRVVTMTRYVRSLSSEAQVNGVLGELESTFVQTRQDMVRQLPTITALAAIPVLLFLLIVLVQLLMLHRLERKIRRRKSIRGVAKGTAKVETSMQWFRTDFVKLLEGQGFRAELGDISLRLVTVDGKSRLGILPSIDKSSKQP